MDLHVVVVAHFYGLSIGEPQSIVAMGIAVGIRLTICVRFDDSVDRACRALAVFEDDNVNPILTVLAL
jgi:hypothetical protein